jgi:hypothetical protein
MVERLVDVFVVDPVNSDTNGLGKKSNVLPG